MSMEQKQVAERCIDQREKHRKRIFLLFVLLFFIVIFFFNYVTPMLSDDYYYALSSREASGFLDLVKQEYNQYMTWIGRSVAHLTLRIFFCLPRIVFKVANSICFMVLSFILYRITDHRKRWDIALYLLVQMGLWFFTVDFSQTILWETGACNYLFCTTLIFGFLLTVRNVYRKNSRLSGAESVLSCIGLFLFGVLAGWCSENTSGAAIVFVLLYFLHSAAKTHRATGRLLSALLGNITGFAFMILAPGNQIRSAQTKASDPESYSGIAGMIARFQKVSLNMNEEFFWLMAAYLVSAVLLSFLAIRLNRSESRKAVIWRTLRTSLFYVFLYVITCYALVMTQETQVRAYFGGGIFLLAAVLQNLEDILVLEKREDSQIVGRTAVYGGLLVLLLHFFYVCLDDGTNCFRIYRDVTERENWIVAQRDAGSQDITVAKVHPAFYNDYSSIDRMELDEDPEYWTNDAVESFFGVEKIRAIDYDDWEALTGQ